MSSADIVPSELQLKVARNILDYIRLYGMSAGSHLTEKELVEEFHVSRPPIRRALQYLAEKGVVERRENRGFFVSVSSGELRSDQLQLPKTAEEQLGVSIARDWFEQKVPRSFSEAEFRRRYGLGRLAATRTLLKLLEEGIVSRNTTHGWQFEPTLNTREAHDASYAFRMVVEPAAILMPTFDLDRGLAEMSRYHHETALEQTPEEDSLGTLFDIDAEFHRLIGVSSRNSFFLAAIERQNSLRRLVEYASLLDRGRLIESCTEHMAILAALEAGDREEAAELMRRHLQIAADFAPEYCPGDPDHGASSRTQQTAHMTRAHGG